MSITVHKPGLLVYTASTAMSILLVCYSIINTRLILLPFGIALLLVLVLYPLYRWLKPRNIGRVWAFGICLLVTIITGSVLTVLINRQIVTFIKAMLQP